MLAPGYRKAVADITRSRTVAAGLTDVWDVLADFGAISAWADNVDHSCLLTRAAGGEPVGTTRRVQVGRNALVERITRFEPPYALEYDIEGLPGRLRRVTNCWTLHPAHQGDIVVTLTSTVEIGTGARRLIERVLCRVLARQSDVMLAGLAERMEKRRV
jgi:hypothetical protein